MKDSSSLTVTILTAAIIITVTLCSARTCHGRCNHIDRDSLLRFNRSLLSPGLSWHLSADCCSWDGVGCNRRGRVTKLWLPSRGLEGAMPPSILNLTTLSLFNLSSNKFSGPLPDKLFSSLRSLKVLDLSQNRISGSISPFDYLPGEARFLNLSSNALNGTIEASFFRMATNLQTLDVSNNSFFGSIPSHICGFFSPSLEHLDVSRNSFGGPIPPGFGRCSNLMVFRAGFNNLSGEVPRDLYRSSRMRELSLPGNKLSGSISENVVNLIELRILALYGNELTGKIPEKIGELSNLEELHLHTNRLSGKIPDSLSNCTKLTALILKVNRFEGEISAFDFSRFFQIELLDVGANCLTGTLPRSLFSCKTLRAIRLADNNLHGEIPRDVRKLQSLSFLSLAKNRLTNVASAIRILRGCKNLTTVLLTYNFYDEALPGDESLIGAEDFKSLQVLGLGGCRFTGFLPPWLTRIPKLKVLDISNNSITGEIPNWVGSLEHVFYFNLSNNRFSGDFPISLTRLQKLENHLSDEDDVSRFELPVVIFSSGNAYKRISRFPPSLDLHSNRITGKIPAEIGNLRAVLVLDLSNNDMYGGIPETISNLTELEKLDLSRNRISGKIPPSLKNLNFLAAFNVSYNDLEGLVPTGGQFETFTRSSFEGNRDLCGTILQRPCGFSGEQTPESSRREDRDEEEEIFNWPSFVIGYGVGLFVSAMEDATRSIEIL